MARVKLDSVIMHTLEFLSLIYEMFKFINVTIKKKLSVFVIRTSEK